MTTLFMNRNNQKSVFFHDKEIPFDIQEYAEDYTYDFSYIDMDLPVYKKTVRLSLLIDLSKDADEIYGQFKQNTRNEINKAKKYDFTIDYNFDIDSLYEMHNDMLKSKELGLIDKSYYFGIAQKPVATCISGGGANPSCSFVYN